jgi:hypothetical protein
MKTFRFLLAAGLGLLLLGSSAFAQVMNSSWIGDQSNNYTTGNWSNSTYWLPNGVPNNAGSTIYDVTINWNPNGAPFNGPELDMNATVHNLNLVNRAFFDNQAFAGKNLTVTNSTAFITEQGHDGEYAAMFNSGGTWLLGDLYNYEPFDTHTLTGAFLFAFNGGTIGFRNADVFINNGTLIVSGATSRIIDQNTGQNALRDIEENNGVLDIQDGYNLTLDHLTNNGSISANTGNGLSTTLTISNNLANYDNNTHTLTGGYYDVGVANVPGTATIRFNNADIRTLSNATIVLRGAGASIQDLTGLNALRNLQGIQGGSLTSGGTLTITPIGGTFTNNGGLHTIGDGANVTINGNLQVTNNGHLIVNAPTANSSTVLTVTGSTLMAGTNQDMGGQPGVTTIHATEAHFINGIEYRGAALTGTGTVYADILFTQNAYLDPGHSPGQLTLVGNVNLDTSITTYIQIGGVNPGAEYDQILQSGGLFTLHGTLDLTVIDGAENVIIPADTFDVITSTQTLAGNFDNFFSGDRLYTSDGIGSFIVTYAGQNKVTLSDFALVQRLTSVVSRKNHGGVDRDIMLNLSGNPTVECRNTGGNYTLIFSFVNDVVSGDADLTSGTGNVAGAPVFAGNTMKLNLSGITNQQVITVNLANITDSFGQVLPDTEVRMSVLVGDTNGNGIVNASDIIQTKSSVGQAVSDANFRRDVNVNGSINASDVSLVKIRSGTSLPQPQRPSDYSNAMRGR